MNCKDCVFFKTFASFDGAICRATSQPVDPLAKACDKFIPQGRFSEWGEETGGHSCR
ncbi:hypothetical protein [Pelotomaculum propionicicum]|uniref:Benzylsuccinate synthase beta subunit domain-containing protein n=1 Tax=Pelotomaculum propionicicum TaxID=258475 RepID=A0A4Y7RNM7_9FIRM|nr:hypothetical protein [Pelotomaculum propionicicum]NLI12777.1 hypothetical protein [Peptococcaceae bacterium]TEB10594.1 hypothetical protein Pmgp_02284 [Pelotomaculum propionicicum]